MKKTQWYIHKDNEKKYEEFKAKLTELGISMSEFHNALLPNFLKSLESFNPKFRTISTPQELIQLK